MVKKCNRKRSLDAYSNVKMGTQTTLIGDDPQEDTTEIPDTVYPIPYTLRKVTKTVAIEGAFVHYEGQGDKSIFTVQGADQYGTTEQIKDRAEKLIEELKDLIDILEEE